MQTALIIHYLLVCVVFIYLINHFLRLCDSTDTFSIRYDQYTTGSDIVDVIILENTLTGEMVSFIPEYGGGVDQLRLLAGARLRDVLWSFDGNATEIKLNPTWKGKMLIPYANRIGGATYNFNGTTFLLPKNDVAGLNNSLHGLLWNRKMQVSNTSVNETSSSVTLTYSFNGKDVGYPFHLQVSIEYILSFDGFFVNIVAFNKDQNGWPLPFFHGFHPYFLMNVSRAVLALDNCGEKNQYTHVQVTTGPQYPPPRYSNMIPNGKTAGPWNRFNGSSSFGGTFSKPEYFDDEAKALNVAECGHWLRHTLTDFEEGVRVTLLTTQDFKYLQIFTGAVSTWGVNAVVLEPLSAMSDAYNNHDGLHILSPLETFRSSFGITQDSV